jgi:hypothetical protein
VTRHVGHPALVDRVVARTPTLTVAIGRVVVDPDGVAFELVAQERRLPGDRPRRGAMDELHAVVPGQGVMDHFPMPFPGGVERGAGSGSADGLVRFDHRVPGLPATGDLELVVRAPSHDVDVTVVLDGDALRRAAACATPLWPEEGDAAIRSGR